MKRASLRLFPIFLLLATIWACTSIPVSVQVAPTAVPNTPVAAARAFFKALTDGDANTAGQWMTVAARAQYGSILPGIASSLRDCSRSVAEFTTTNIVGGGQAKVNVTLTPPCASQTQFFAAIGRTLGSNEQELYRKTAIGLCYILVANVNDQWKVTALIVL